jgi:hypothetical protein
MLRLRLRARSAYDLAFFRKASYAKKLVELHSGQRLKLKEATNPKFKKRKPSH